jgi:NTP pyrophosphatase (non-canonical NTP hydrolase)
MDTTSKIHDTVTTLQELKKLIKQFVVERDWTQYHTPKNLSMSIAIEAAELMEKFQFVENEESFDIVKKHKDEIAHELVDVLGYVINFANVCDIDLSSYFVEKLELNKKKYPVDVAKGSYGKYTKLGINARKK